MLSNALAADRAHIADLEARILDLERSIAALHLEKEAAQERLDSYKYPVLTLPNEIISEIFIHFLPTYPVCPPSTGNLSPTCLTHICRKWRDIALGTPALWRAMSLSGTHNTFDWLEVWLGRSGCCPLSIRLDEWADGDVPLASELISTVLLHRARLEHLQLRLFGPPPVIETRLPLLSHLDLEFDDDIPNGPITFHEDDVPLLRAVTLDILASHSVILPWTQLTSLTLRVISFDSCGPILRQTTNLIHCQLDLVHDHEESNHVPDITLPHLKSLCCSDNNYGQMSDCIGPLIVPALRSLQVTERFLGPYPIGFLTSFVSKSSCKLQDVHIRGERIVPEDLYRMAFPSIRFVFDSQLVGDEGSMDSDGDSY
ncbi:F-box domain-containing protein [Mycena venus]|uniref:F-box domain-containing protein n=1 Tax=Mycena venus TaxID=2733690 RepID=A0A8H6YLR2_9AGAR|nr:F-box domain-containing protein [Mycena venus]